MAFWLEFIEDRERLPRVAVIPIAKVIEIISSGINIRIFQLPLQRKISLYRRYIGLSDIASLLKIRNAFGIRKPRLVAIKGTCMFSKINKLLIVG